FVSKASGVFAGIRRHYMAIANELVLVYQQPFHTDRSTRVSLIGADADFSAQTVTETIGESRRRIPVDTGGIDFVQESLCVGFVLSDDGIGVPGSVSMNVVDRFIETVDHLRVHDEVQILGTESGIAQFDACRR